MKRLSEEEKKRIIELCMNGKSPREIIKITNRSPTTIYKVINEYKEKIRKKAEELAKEIEEIINDDEESFIDLIAEKIMHETPDNVGKILITGKLFLEIFKEKENEIDEILRTINSLKCLHDNAKNILYILQENKRLKKELENLKKKYDLLRSGEVKKWQEVLKLIDILPECKNVEVAKYILGEANKLWFGDCKN